MLNGKKFYELDFEEYIRNSEPEKKDKSYAWSTAIGLQQVDGLTPSKYLFDTAKRNIDGEITVDEAKRIIDRYYELKTVRSVLKQITLFLQKIPGISEMRLCAQIITILKKGFEKIPYILNVFFAIYCWRSIIYLKTDTFI